MGQRERLTGFVTEHTRDVIAAYLEALNRADRDAVAACVTEDFVNEHTSTRGTSIVGREAYRERLAGFLAEFEQLHYELEDLIVDRDRAAAPYVMSFRWQGQPVRIRGIFRFRVRDDLIARRVDYWDSAQFDRQVSNRQVGASPDGQDRHDEAPR